MFWSWSRLGHGSVLVLNTADHAAEYKNRTERYQCQNELDVEKQLLLLKYYPDSAIQARKQRSIADATANIRVIHWAIHFKMQAFQKWPYNFRDCFLENAQAEQLLLK